MHQEAKDTHISAPHGTFKFDGYVLITLENVVKTCNDLTKYNKLVHLDHIQEFIVVQSSQPYPADTFTCRLQHVDYSIH